ncbi:hypothetical protein PSACC_01407 [Paramicrosporidium saccamoebae]|uniref:Uncharacterized protein n=1 Tax=Paramicrosporidium saccamoebae TaxID=1246581 RepID=A0A2H9TLX0_9FUNG|nr:hypothetical protein PSACC_01407 [Paramicrosporidium saccamoebae]
MNSERVNLTDKHMAKVRKVSVGPPPRTVESVANAENVGNAVNAINAGNAENANFEPNGNDPKSTLEGAESYFGLVETVEDAVLVVEACRRALLPRVQYRLGDRDRYMIRSGSVFIFTELESGIKRWTDGKIWSPSRIAGEFLIYRQLEQRISATRKPMTMQIGILGNVASDAARIEEPDEKSTSPEPLLKKEGLMKKTISLNIDNSTVHLICYYREAEVGKPHELAYTIPSINPFFKALKSPKLIRPPLVSRPVSLESASSRTPQTSSRTPPLILPSGRRNVKENYGFPEQRRPSQHSNMSHYPDGLYAMPMPHNPHAQPFVQVAYRPPYRQPMQYLPGMYYAQRPSVYNASMLPYQQWSPPPQDYPPTGYGYHIPRTQIPYYPVEVRQSHPGQSAVRPAIGLKRSLPALPSPGRRQHVLAPLRIDNLAPERDDMVKADDGLLLRHFAQMATEKSAKEECKPPLQVGEVSRVL